MEYCGGGDLAGYLRNKRISEAQARHFMQQLSFGMKELWLNNFVHVSPNIVAFVSSFTLFNDLDNLAILL